MIFVANWKSSIESREILDWMHSYADCNHQQVILVPSPYLYWLISMFPAVNIGMQDFDYANGTAAISSKILHDCKIKVVCIGHSEIRNRLHLKNDILRQRIAAALDARLTPIVCISGYHESDLDVLPVNINSECWIAYEPEWAIGNDKAITAEVLTEHLHMLDLAFKKRYNGASTSVKWLYGGAVSADNILSLATVPGLSGFLVGRASLKINDWSSLIKCI